LIIETSIEKCGSKAMKSEGKSKPRVMGHDCHFSGKLGVFEG
jgi:hypothetical protein